MSFSNLEGIVGNQPINFFQLPDTTSRIKSGSLLNTYDVFWGGMEVVYGNATAGIRQFGLCTMTPTFVSGVWQMQMAEVTNTANLGSSVCVALTVMTTGQRGWFAIYGLVPVNCNASVAANTTFGIVATGQGGAVANGKQILNASIIAAGSTTVVKAAVNNSGSTLLTVPAGADGWFAGAYLSGTGVASGATVSSIDASGTQVVMSGASTAAINGNVTATYNNATIYYNVAFLNRPFAQGQTT